MTAQIIDGRAIANNIKEKVKEDVAALKAQGTQVGLAVILVGDDPASHVYVGSKIKACEAAGIESFEHRMADNCTEQDIHHVIKNLNNNPNVHGILMQLPLPDHLLDVQEKLVQSITPQKDVDGLTVTNAGKLFLAHGDGHVPCTPQGCMHLINSVEPNLRGKTATIIGRSNLFGKPMGQLLAQADCTVNMVHRYTKDLVAASKDADILVVATGNVDLIKAEHVKPGAIVIDVGINRVPSDNPDKKWKIVGDVDYEGVKQVAGYITPVPGGVGPTTIACLLANTVKAAQIN